MCSIEDHEYKHEEPLSIVEAKTAILSIEEILKAYFKSRYYNSHWLECIPYVVCRIYYAAYDHSMECIMHYAYDHSRKNYDHLLKVADPQRSYSLYPMMNESFWPYT